MAGADNKPAADKPAKQDGKGKDGKKKPGEKEEPELTEEELELKKNLELMVERVKEADPGLQKAALESICNEIRTATASMTSVPKPLKFLRAQFETLRARLDTLPTGPNRSMLSDIVSVLSTTIGREGERLTLKYRLMGSKDDIGVWGHEYLRHLAGEIGDEYQARVDRGEGANVDDLLHLVHQIVPYHMTHNAEPEAVDLLLEVERLESLTQYVDDKNYGRTCLYLVSCCNYLPEPEDAAVLQAAHTIYSKMGKHHDAMRVALRMNRRDVIEATFAGCSDGLEKRQLCYLLARQGVVLNLEEGPCAVMDDELRDALRAIISNSRLSEHFLALGRDLDVMEPKAPEDVYKTHLTEGRTPAGEQRLRLLACCTSPSPCLV